MCEMDNPPKFIPGFEIKSYIKASDLAMQSSSGILPSDSLTWAQAFCSLERLRGKLQVQSIFVVTDMPTN